MSQIILDISANTHKNDWEYLKRMLDELKAVDSGKHEIIIKHQLFEVAGANIPLHLHIFKRAYDYAEKLGYETTSSVFDELALECLLDYDIPFVKIANNRSLDWLIGKIPRKIPVYVSHSNNEPKYSSGCIYMACISSYPASIDDYEKVHKGKNLSFAISDHTTNWDLFNKYEPEIYECHYVLEHDVNNLDGGLFARTPKMLAEIL
jgi:sialic acid synthase SpsE